MHSSTFLGLAAFSTAVIAQANNAIPSVNVGQIETAIEQIIPTPIANLIPHETQAINDLAAYVTSLTAQPEFTSVVAALESALPSSALAEFQSAPASFVLQVATGTEAAFFTNLPVQIIEYAQSVGEQALSILESDVGLTPLPVGLIPTAVASGYGSPATGYAYPTGGYYNPTGAYGTGYATGATGASGSGGLQPNITSYNGGNAGPTPVPFQGAAAPRNSAIGVGALMAGVAMLFVC